MGPDSGKPVDYPLVAVVIGEALASGDRERAILLCGSGAGVTVAANRLPGIRAAYGSDHYTAHQMVEHDHVNVLTLGARVMGPEDAADIVEAFVQADFTPEERHQRRLSEVLELERDRSPNAATRLHDAGQSLWLDNITRALLDGGDAGQLHQQLRGDGPDLQPDDLRQGDDGERRLQRRQYAPSPRRE